MYYHPPQMGSKARTQQGNPIFELASLVAEMLFLSIRCACSALSGVQTLKLLVSLSAKYFACVRLCISVNVVGKADS
jgi:hypothetical protein